MNSAIFCDMAPCSLVAVLYTLTDNLIYRTSFHCLHQPPRLSLPNNTLFFCFVPSPHHPLPELLEDGRPLPPRTLILIIASGMVAETLKHLQNPTRSILESQSNS
jgi:hypothetical protein